MKKSTKSEADPKLTAVPLTLVEFCARLSATVKRPELIAAFESIEQRAGRLKDVPDAYRGRFDAFVTKPL